MATSLSSTALPRLRGLACVSSGLLAATICLGCSSDDPLTFSPTCVVLTPQRATGSPLIVRQGSGSACHELELELEIVTSEDVSDVFAMELTFRYPLFVALDPTLEAGPAWTTDPDGPAGILTPILVEAPPGTVQLGITRDQSIHPPGGPPEMFDAPAGTVLAKISFFRAAVSGNANLTFRSASLSTWTPGGSPTITVSLDEVANPDGIIVGQIGIF